VIGKMDAARAPPGPAVEEYPTPRPRREPEPKHERGANDTAAGPTAWPPIL